MKKTNSENKTRLLLLGNASQVHLRRWASYFGDNGYDVFTLSLEPARDFPTRLERFRMPGFLPGFIRYPLAVPRVRDIIKTFKPQLINAHFLPNYGLIAALINRTPWIFSSWGSDIMVLPEKSPFHLIRTRFVLKRASYITSDADVMTKRLVKLGVSPGRILTVPFGVDTTVFSPPKIEEGEEKPRILSCRKLEKVYSIKTVIEAFPAIKADLPDATLTIAGDGYLKKKLIAQAKETGNTEDILFVGDVDHDKVPALLREHNIYVSTALSDTTSVSLLEAMACGLYPVVTNIPANREWIVDGTNGSCFQPGHPGSLSEAIVHAWKNRSLRKETMENNLATIRDKADWYQNMSMVKGMFEKILDEEGGKS